MTEIKLYSSPKNMKKLAGLATFFLLLGGYIVNEDSSQMLAWISIFLLGLLPFTLVVYNILNRSSLMVINKTGIYSQASNKKLVNWEVIEDAYITYLYNKPYIALVINQALVSSQKKGKLYRTYSNLNKTLGFEEVTLSLGMLDVDEQRFLEFILSMAKTKQESQRQTLLMNAQLV